VRKAMQVTAVGNGTHAPAKPAPAPKAQPELLAFEAAPPTLENFHEVTIEELFAAEPPQAEAPEPAPKPPAPPSSADLWFSPVETPPPAPEPVAAAAPPKAPKAEMPSPEPVAESQPKTVVSPSPVEAPSIPVKPAPVSVQQTAIVKASIFSVIDDDEEEVAEGGTNWAEKYIQAKPQQASPPQIERREPVRPQPEPAHSPAVSSTAKSPGAAQKQPSLNLNQDNVARFKGTDKTIIEGEDLDVPTWMRVRGKVGKSS
jgi:hypothetical protein